MLKNLPYALSFFLLSCAGVVDSKDPVTKSAKLAASNTYPIKELTFGDSLEEGWGADIRLSIVQITSTDSSKLYKAISSYKGGNLGLSVEIPKVHGKKGFGAGMKLSGIGSESD